MKKPLRMIAISAALCFSVGSANADNFIAPGDLTTFIQPNTIFGPSGTVVNDQIEFTLGAAATGFAGSAVTLSIADVLGISPFDITLFSGANGIHTTQIGSTFNQSTQGNSFSIDTSGLTPGTYHLDLVGATVGSAGGSYALAISAVPEPETYAMLLVGLGLVGFAARRRKHNFN